MLDNTIFFKMTWTQDIAMNDKKKIERKNMQTNALQFVFRFIFSFSFAY